MRAKEFSLNKLKTSLIEYDSTVFADIGSLWTKKEAFFGIGYKEDKFYKLEVQFKREFNPTPFWAIDISKVKRSRIKSRAIIDEFQQMNIDTLFTLNKDSLELRTRGNIYANTSHQAYSILIKTKNSELKVIQLYDAKYFQSNAPTNERELLLKQINRIKAILNE